MQKASSNGQGREVGKPIAFGSLEERLTRAYTPKRRFGTQTCLFSY